MKIICNREGLLSACQLVNVAVPSSSARDILPVLRNIKAIVDGNSCLLMTTDNQVGIRMDVRSITVDEPGEALLPADRLLAILRESADDEVTIEANTDRCTLQGKHAEFEMPGEDPASFPDFPTFAEDKYHEMTAGVLREMIRRVAFAVVANPNEARWGATTGILWELRPDGARLVATDGKRMAVADGPATAHGGQSTAGQIPVAPAKAMTLLERNLSGSEKTTQDVDEKVRIAIRQNEILIKTERSTIYSRLVEGRFPDYQKVVPQKHKAKIALQVDTFYPAVRQAAIMTSDESRGVTFSFGPRQLTLKAARGSGLGSSRVEMDLDYNGEPIDISFDPRYLTDMLRVLEPEAELTLELTDGNSPALFRNDTSDYLYVVVPMVQNRGQR